MAGQDRQTALASSICSSARPVVPTGKIVPGPRRDKLLYLARQAVDRLMLRNQDHHSPSLAHPQRVSTALHAPRIQRLAGWDHHAAHISSFVRSASHRSE
jgi:hypothetical protein